jgi:hypothetical protein
MRCEPVDEVGVRGRAAKLVCEGCGCTNERACPGGCCWISLDPPLCSACANRDELEEACFLPPRADEPAAFFNAERCPASATPALHAPIWLTESESYCTRCRQGFCT